MDKSKIFKQFYIKFFRLYIPTCDRVFRSPFVRHISYKQFSYMPLKSASHVEKGPSSEVIAPQNSTDDLNKLFMLLVFVLVITCITLYWNCR